MKFKNSYILLIAMAIFLLVSIGSACASENFTTDSDAQLASADADVVFADEKGDITLNDGETTQEKINTTVNADSDKEKYSYDDDKNITVTVKDNESNELEITKSNLTVFEGNKSINFSYNNSKITILDKLNVGNHTLIINYLGNANYTNSSTEFLLKIFGNYTLETPDTVLSDDGTVIIPVKVFDGVEYVKLEKEYANLTLTYTNSTGNKTSEIIAFDEDNGNITFTLDKTKFVAASVKLNYTNAVENKTILLRLATTISADDARVKVTENKTIAVKVSADGEQLTINKTDLKVLIDGKDTSFAYNNSIITLTIANTGSYNVTIIYNGNDTYYTSNKTVKLNVWGNQTINPQDSASVDGDNNVNITINLSNGAEPVNVDLSKLNVTLFYKLNNQTLNKTVSGIELLADNQTITFKVAENFDSAYVTIKYAAENNLTANTVLKMATKIISDDSINFGAGEVVNFTIEVQTLNGTKINVTDKNIKVLSNGKEVKFTCNNSVITLTDKFTYGVYNLTVNYLGSETYATSTKNIKLAVYGINATSSINVNSTKKGEVKISIINGNETINITTEDLKDKLNVTYKNGNDTVVIKITQFEVKNGTLYFTLENGNFTKATLNIKYNQTETNVTLNRIYNARIDTVNIVNEYRNGNFTFRLVDVDDNSNLTGRTVSLYTTGNIRAGFSTTTDSNGIASYRNINLYIFDQSSTSLNMKQLEVGNYSVEISVADPIKATTLKTNLTVTPANIKIVIDPYKEYYGSDKNVTITATNAKNGEAVSGILLKLSMPQTSGQYYYVNTDANGVARISAKGLVSGNYDLTVSNNDTKNIVNTSTKTTITVLKIPTTINAKDVTVYFNTGTTATIKVTDKSGKAVAGMYILVQLDKDSKKMYLFQTDKNGKIAFSASLGVGTHKMTISSADSRYDAKSVTKTIKVKKASAKIKAKKVTTYYKSGKTFTVKLINAKNKKPIYDGKINIKIFVSSKRYYNYDGNTGANGKLKLLLDSLKPGKYKVIVSDGDNKNYTAKNVTSKIVIKKAPTKITAKKLTAKKGEKKNLKITVKNKKTKKAIPKIKVKAKVFTGKKSKTYTLKTNAKGVASLNVNKLKVGNHKVTIKSANKYCVGKAKKTTVTIKK